MKFRCERYPKLKVRQPDGRYLQFIDGELDVSDKAAIETLKGLPEDRGVKAVGGRPSKGADDKPDSE